jgi:O-antigen/teichoic acid export membrane protein
MLRQKFLVQFGSQFILKIMGIGAGLVVARVAGPEVVGTIAFGTAYVSIWGFITGLFGTGHIKLISEGKDLGKCLSTYVWLQGGSMLVYFTIVVIIFLIQKNILNYEFESETQQIVIIILLFATLANQVLDFGNITFTAKLEQAKANYPLFIKTIIWQIGRIVLVVIGFRAVGLVSWNLIITLLLIPIAWRYLKELPRGGFSGELAKRYFSIAVPIFLIVVINSMIGNADKLFLVHFTDTTELGYYSVAFSIGGMFLLISRSVGMVFFPLFSGLIADNNWELVNKKILVFQRFVVLFIFPPLCAIFIIGEPFLLALLGEQYRPSVIPFLILLFATYIDIIGMPYGNVIAGIGKFYMVVLGNAIQLLFYVLGLFLFVSPVYFNLGATGLALNLLIVNIIKNSLFVGLSLKYGDIILHWKNLIIHGAILLPLSVLYFVSTYYDLDNGIWWIIVGPSTLIIFYFILFVFRQINIDDIKILLDVINVRKTGRYITNELKQKDPL